MTDRPVIYSGPMVRALLDGRKTQTRRLLKLRGYPGFFQFGVSDTPGYDWHFRRKDHVWEDYEHTRILGFLQYQLGDRLWVRENFQAHSWASDCVTIRYQAETRTKGFTAQIEQIPYPDGEKNSFKFIAPKGPDYWRPSIHMPRWASRLTLNVTDVRIERLQDITSDDAEAEGLLCGETEGGDLVWSGVHQTYPIPEQHCHHWPEEAFAELWNSINGPDAWSTNPWVVAVSFDVHRGNIDKVGAE